MYTISSSIILFWLLFPSDDFNVHIILAGGINPYPANVENRVSS